MLHYTHYRVYKNGIAHNIGGATVAHAPEENGTQVYAIAYCRTDTTKQNRAGKPYRVGGDNFKRSLGRRIAFNRLNADPLYFQGTPQELLEHIDEQLNAHGLFRWLYRNNKQE